MGTLFICLIAIIALTLVILFLLLRLKKLSELLSPVNISNTQKQLASIQNVIINKILTDKTKAKSLNEILDSVLGLTLDMFKANIGCILLYNKSRQGLEIKYNKGVPRFLTKEILVTQKLDDKIVWPSYERGMPIHIQEVKNHTHSLKGTLYKKGNSVLCVPIKTSDAVVGVYFIEKLAGKAPLVKSDLKVMNFIASQVAIVLGNEDYQKRLSRKINEMEVLFKMSEQVSHSLDLQVTLQKVAELAAEITQTDACSLRLLNKDTNTLDLMASHGVHSKYKHKGSLKIGEGVGGYVARNNVAVTIPNLKEDTRIKYISYLNDEGLLSLVSVPIENAKGKVIGIISVYRKKVYNFHDDTINLLSTFANNVSIAIENARLFDSLKTNYYNTIKALALAIEARDTYTNGHSERVTELAVRLALEMGIPESDIKILRLAGRLHDIGKIAVPDDILLKKGKLTKEEYEKIKQHPIKGMQLLQPLKFLEHILPNIKHHHEWYNGKGYPDGLSKTKIPLLARILSVADAYDAMTSKRPYRAPLSRDAALKELLDNSGSQFDPGIVDVFKKINIE